MDSTITEDELTRHLGETIDRVRTHGERFTIERDGEPVAVLAPAPTAKQFTVADFLALWERIPHPDEDFADDVEAVQAAQTIAEPSAWPD